VKFIKLGLPKGSLEKATIELFKKSGWNIVMNARSYFPFIDDDEIRCTMARAQEMSRFVERGIFDVGLTGKDWILENGSDVVMVKELIANKNAWNDTWKREKIEQIAMLLEAALNAEGMVGLKMNVPKKALESVVNILPSLNAPTIANLYGTDWFSVETVISEKEVRKLIPQLIKKGAEGIIEYPLYKII